MIFISRIVLLLSILLSMPLAAMEDTSNQQGYTNLNDIKIDDEAYVAGLQADEIDDKDDAKDSEKDKLPDWMVQSCLENMPPLLRGIYNYLRSPNSMDAKYRVPTFHRFLLVGDPGTSKSTTAEAVAQSLNIPKKIVAATSLVGPYRAHSAIKIRMFFETMKKKPGRKMYIFNEIHKLFEDYKNGHTDHSLNAAAFWEEVDEIERKYPDLLMGFTTNHFRDIPKEIQSRFRAQYIVMPKLSPERIRQAFWDIITHDKTIKMAEDITPAKIDSFCQKLEKYSFRDVRLLIDEAKMFAYINKEQSFSGVVELQVQDFTRAYNGFVDPAAVLDFNRDDSKTETERQQDNHRESIALQKEHFAKQQLQQLVLAVDNKHRGIVSSIEENISLKAGLTNEKSTYDEKTKAIKALANGVITDSEVELYSKGAKIFSKQKKREDDEKEARLKIEKDAEEAKKKAEAEKSQENGGSCIVQ